MNEDKSQEQNEKTEAKEFGVKSCQVMNLIKEAKVGALLIMFPPDPEDPGFYANCTPGDPPYVDLNRVTQAASQSLADMAYDLGGSELCEEMAKRVQSMYKYVAEHGSFDPNSSQDEAE